MSLAGVDLASFQGTPGTWVHEAGAITFAGVKLTEAQPDGTRYVDPDAAGDWAYLLAHGLGRIAYCFGHPAVPADETIALFAETVASLGLLHTDAVALDFETTDGLNPAQCSIWARQVMRHLHALYDRVPLLYTYPSFAQAGNCAGLGGYPLWLSDPNHPAGEAPCPAPWKSYAIHQYSTGGVIDRDSAFYPSLAAMRTALGTTPPPVPVLPEETMLLSKGAGAVTPMALPDGAKGIRLLCAEGSAEVRAEFPLEAPKTAINATLSWAHGSHEIDVPEGRHGVRLTRLDSGTGDVSAVAVL